MKHQEAIWIQKLENMRLGVQHATELLEALKKLSQSENINRETISNEIEEIHDFLVWIKNQG